MMDILARTYMTAAYADAFAAGEFVPRDPARRPVLRWFWRRLRDDLAQL